MYTELKRINVVQSDVNLQESATSIKAINNAQYKPKDLILKRPLTFLTEFKTFKEVQSKNYYALGWTEFGRFY